MEAFSAMIPIQVPVPPRVLEELSGRIDQLAPTFIDYARVWQKSVPPNAFSEYVRDFWQRSVLFLDILRQRGNQHEEMSAHGITSVLIYDSELVMRGDELPHPVNYSLLRVIPPEGVEIDDRKRPDLRHRSACRAGTGDWRLQGVERDRPGVQGRAPRLLRRLYRVTCGGTAD